MSEIGVAVLVRCEKCGKVGDDHEIPTIRFPDGTDKTLCDECFRKEPAPLNLHCNCGKMSCWLCGDYMPFY